jgi:hypothetical protein
MDIMGIIMGMGLRLLLLLLRSLVRLVGGDFEVVWMTRGNGEGLTLNSGGRLM